MIIVITTSQSCVMLIALILARSIKHPWENYFVQFYFKQPQRYFDNKKSGTTVYVYIILTVHIQTCKCACLPVCVYVQCTCTYVICILPVYGMCMVCLCIPFNISMAGVLCMNTCTHIYTVPSLYYWQLGLQWSP